jgi:hypothetical protein
MEVLDLPKVSRFGMVGEVYDRGSPQPGLFFEHQPSAMFQIFLSSNQNDVGVRSMSGPADLPHPICFRDRVDKDKHSIEPINQLNEKFRRSVLCIKQANRTPLRYQTWLSINPAPFSKDALLGKAIKIGSTPHEILLDATVILATHY